MKKFLSLLLTGCVAFSLVSCDEQKAEPPKTGSQEATTSNSKPNSSGSIEESLGITKNKVTLTYANWNLGTVEQDNLERRMMAEFNKKYDNIKVELADFVGVGSYAEGLNIAAAAANLPDIIMLTTVPSALTNEWLHDITYMTKNDPDWAKIPAPTRAVAGYRDKTYAIPTGLFIQGYVINKDLFEQENVKPLKYGYSFAEFEAALKALSKPTKGMIGLNDESQMIHWYSPIKDSSLGYFSFDGKEYNLDSDAFREGIKKAKEFAKNGYSYAALPKEQLSNFTGANQGEVWSSGQMGIRFDQSWSITAMNKLPFEYEYIGLPDGKNIIINDFFGIAKSSKNPVEAYLFARWMSFSKEGQMKRLELLENFVPNPNIKDHKISWSSLPIIEDEELWDKYFELNIMTGVREALAGLDKSIAEIVKTEPGYPASRISTQTGLKVGDKENANISEVLTSMFRGDTNPDDYLTRLNELANKAHEEAIAALNDAMLIKD